MSKHALLMPAKNMLKGSIQHEIYCLVWMWHEVSCCATQQMTDHAALQECNADSLGLQGGHLSMSVGLLRVSCSLMTHDGAVKTQMCSKRVGLNNLPCLMISICRPVDSWNNTSSSAMKAPGPKRAVWKCSAYVKSKLQLNSFTCCLLSSASSLMLPFDLHRQQSVQVRSRYILSVQPQELE